MAKWSEKDIEMDFPDCAAWTDYTDRGAFDTNSRWLVRLDDAKQARHHGDPDMPKSPDLGIWTPGRPRLVVEVKDSAALGAKPEQQREYLARLRDPDGQFARRELAPAYRFGSDYLDWLSQTPFPYPFFIVVETPDRPDSKLDEAGLNTLAESVAQALAGTYAAPDVRPVAVLTMAGWNLRFPHFPAIRISAQGAAA